MNFDETAYFTITVTNTGDIALTGVTVSDALAPDCDRSLGDLSAGANDSYTCSLANAVSDFTNGVVVTGSPPVGSAVAAADTAYVEVVGPDVEITKSPDLQNIQSGDTVTFTISVTNTGDITLTTVAIVDAAVPDCNDTVADLNPAAPYSYTCSVANVTADFTNTVVATGTPAAGSTVTDTDSALVNVINPAIQITKTPGSQFARSGGTVTFTISVTNTGDVALSPRHHF